MRLRILACLPVAALITFIALLSASSFVSALEGSASSLEGLPSGRGGHGGGFGSPASITILRHESECDRLFREAHALSHEVTTCELAPACQGSPLLCPAAQDQRVERAFERLRSVLHERCGVPLDLMDYAWGGPAGDGPDCGVAHDWMESAARGAAEPTHFVF